MWDYPRPPRLEKSSRHIQVMFAGEIIADTRNAYRVLETSHPPAWYIPPADINKDCLRPELKMSHCEWKGSARYWSVQVGDQVASHSAWSYPRPSDEFEDIADYLAFYPHIFECFVDGERVQPQPGGFYGGWVTSDIAGPFKGAPGTLGW